MHAAKSLDCVVCGEACVDLLIRPLPRDKPLAGFGTLHVDPIEAVTGGIVPNSSIAMARLGLRVAALSVIGQDAWGTAVQQALTGNGVDARHLVVDQTCGTSVTAVLIDGQGGHSFAFHQGASQLIDKTICEAKQDLFRQSRYALFGYYHLLPQLEADLPAVLAAIRSMGCQTALDTAGGGGDLVPLDRILPHLDFYIPNHHEARQQTGAADPHEMLKIYRSHGMRGLLGIKLGERGALLSTEAGHTLRVEPVAPPGPVVDTTGAGDSFYAGLLTGLARDLPLEQAARLAAAVGACCVTRLGGSSAAPDFDTAWRMAGL